jgi:hypothetical protein
LLEKNRGTRTLNIQPVRLAYQPPASSTFISEQTSHQQPASSAFLSKQISTSHQPNEQVEKLCKYAIDACKYVIDACKYVIILVVQSMCHRALPAWQTTGPLLQLAHDYDDYHGLRILE